MKTLYLHIGTPKTATTAIQTFCLDNGEVLAEKGYWYPMFEYRFHNVSKHRNGHFLVAKLYDENGERDLEREEQIAVEGMEKVLQLFEEHDNIILSDEGIWNGGLLKNVNCWERLQKHIMSKDIAVKVIVYLRRQDDYMFSWWNQQIKEGLHKTSEIDWEEMVERRPYIKMDYDKYLDRISEYVGKENITVRIFDKKAFFGGSIYADFLDAVQLQYTEEFKVLTSVRNPSLTKNNIEIKRIVNRLPDLDVRGNVFFRKALTKLSAQASGDERRGMFSEEESKEFLEKYKEGNARIAKQYMDREELFDYDYHAEEKWSFENEDTITDIINFYGMITLQLLKEIDDLKKQLEVQKRRIDNIRYNMKHPAKAVIGKMRKKRKNSEEA